jgi:hypothetical protein
VVPICPGGAVVIEDAIDSLGPELCKRFALSSVNIDLAGRTGLSMLGCSAQARGFWMGLAIIGEPTPLGGYLAQHLTKVVGRRR